MKWSAAIGKVCFLSGKSDAPQRRTHLRERVNTFSFCGTGGSFLFCRDRSLRPFAAIDGREHWTHCSRSPRLAAASIGCAAVVRRGRLRDRWPCALIPFCAPRRVILFEEILRSLSPFCSFTANFSGSFCGASPLGRRFAAHTEGKSSPRRHFFRIFEKVQKITCQSYFSVL